ncbi:hypothetical protein RJ640_012187 [Escallonia rubra]|uniref:Protein Lines C-terminal domain-containing protein n=1 Tax=Escallonia rubra TaxID=112253 RepID=A0AA88UFY0_9ASTE|nr:hypothetical protein RJ640_012187 [Escallonia rubra]
MSDIPSLSLYYVVQALSCWEKNLLVVANLALDLKIMTVLLRSLVIWYVHHLIPLLAVKSQYVQHLAGNVLVVISRFAARSVHSLNEVHFGENYVSLRSSNGNALIETAYHGQLKSCFAFCGSLIQLFCSLVAQIGSPEAAAASLDKHPAIHEICSIIPKVLACWCGPEGICSNARIAPYFRHKILKDWRDNSSIYTSDKDFAAFYFSFFLDEFEIGGRFRNMLMIRLSFQLQLNHTTLSSWLNLIHKYFQDLLLEPITQLEPDQDDCLEGSPFLVGCSVEKKSFSSRHLQRLAVFLFLRYSFSLINLRERTEEQYGCANMKSCLVLDQDWSPESSREKILFDLFEWLRRHLPANILVDQEKYLERCTSFALSFLQLYMQEVVYMLPVKLDDMLFEVLLQLFSLPFCSELEIHRGEKTSQEAEDDKLFLVSNLFSPIRLFHLFLAELIYDHQVLLDYLISKDTGASCAEYLLRCLRTVCESWNLFAEFSLDGNFVNRSSCKKRKLNAHFQGELSSADVQGSTLVVLVEDECEEHIYGSKHLRTNKLPFEDAVKCLLSLKKSVENLHQKNLFPYNPDVLLRRIAAPDEPCTTFACVGLKLDAKASYSRRGGGGNLDMFECGTKASGT